jgi:MoaA/NifB/PqqE/SkfB family radical SAM enzyme
MNIDNIKKIELEITSNCNAACPGCQRTRSPGKYEITGFKLKDLQRIFPTSNYISGKEFKFCGVLGDPVFNEECLQMVEYIVINGGRCQISTNGGIRPASWWRQLGELSNRTKKVDVNFCVDGHKETNHIYRVNTVFDVIERNMTAYAQAGGMASWIYIVFDHNEHELSVAEAHAKRLGFKFATRTGMRNSIHNWTAQIKQKDHTSKKVVSNEVIVTTTGDKEHSKVDEFIEIFQFVENSEQNPEQIDHDEKKKILDSIVCKMVHEGEIFIASNQTLWPCCFLWDSMVQDSYKIREKLSEYGDSWNDLKSHSIDDILNHRWYNIVLMMSWDPTHNKHLKRCIKSCAKNKAFQNEIKFKND